MENFFSDTACFLKTSPVRTRLDKGHSASISGFPSFFSEEGVCIKRSALLGPNSCINFALETRPNYVMTGMYNIYCTYTMIHNIYIYRERRM